MLGVVQQIAAELKQVEQLATGTDHAIQAKLQQAVQTVKQEHNTAITTEYVK